MSACGRVGTRSALVVPSNGHDNSLLIVVLEKVVQEIIENILLENILPITVEASL